MLKHWIRPTLLKWPGVANCLIFQCTAVQLPMTNNIAAEAMGEWQGAIAVAVLQLHLLGQNLQRRRIV